MACTECPDGGVFDVAHCFFGEASDGSVAGCTATLAVWTYTSDDHTCERVDEMLRDGPCVWGSVPGYTVRSCWNCCIDSHRLPELRDVFFKQG